MRILYHHRTKSRDGQASHYYSQPFYRVTGTVTLPSGPVEVTGNAWLDTLLLSLMQALVMVMMVSGWRLARSRRRMENEANWEGAGVGVDRS